MGPNSTIVAYCAMRDYWGTLDLNCGWKHKNFSKGNGSFN